jgi:hypothetical protein
MIEYTKKRYIENAIVICVLPILAYLPSGDFPLLPDSILKVVCLTCFVVFEIVNFVCYKIGVKY